MSHPVNRPQFKCFKQFYKILGILAKRIVGSTIQYLFIWITTAETVSNYPIVSGKIIHLCFPGTVIAHNTVNENNRIAITYIYVMDTVTINENTFYFVNRLGFSLCSCARNAAIAGGQVKHQKQKAE